MVKWTLLTALVLGINSFAVKAEIFKCTIDGVDTYSQMPCADDAKVVEVKPSQNEPKPFDTYDLVQECVELLKTEYQWKDRQSLRVESHRTDIIEDGSGLRKVLILSINARNSYGAYAGTDDYRCFLNHTGKKLSPFQQSIPERVIQP
ncbi:MAG: hypothetical protein ACRC6P_18000 [Shewanella oncorhynchi]